MFIFTRFGFHYNGIFSNGAQSFLSVIFRRSKFGRRTTILLVIYLTHAK